MQTNAIHVSGVAGSEVIMSRWLVVLLSLFAVSGAASAAAPVWLELAERPTSQGAERRRPAPWEPELTIYKDGSWTRAGASGQLDRRERTRLTTAITKARLRMDPKPRAVCTGFPRSDEQLTIRGRGSLVWSVPCGRPIDPSAEALLTLVRELTVAPDPHAELYVWSEQSLESPMPRRRVVHADGRWVVSGFGPRDGSGELAPKALAELRARIERTTFALSKARPKPCGARLEWHRTITAQGQPAVTWSGPCGSGPDGSLVALDRYVNDLTR